MCASNLWHSGILLLPVLPISILPYINCTYSCVQVLWSGAVEDDSYGSLPLHNLSISEVVDKACKSELQHDRCAKQLQDATKNGQDVAEGGLICLVRAQSIKAVPCDIRRLNLSTVALNL